MVASSSKKKQLISRLFLISSGISVIDGMLSIKYCISSNCLYVSDAMIELRYFYGLHLFPLMFCPLQPHFNGTSVEARIGSVFDSLYSALMQAFKSITTFIYTTYYTIWFIGLFADGSVQLEKEQRPHEQKEKKRTNDSNNSCC